MNVCCRSNPEQSPKFRTGRDSMLRGSKRIWLAALCLSPCYCELVVNAAEPVAKKTVWLTADEVRRPGALRITWAATPLRDALRNLSQSQRLAILLDRRVDPEQTVSITLEGISPAEAVEQ